MFYSHEILTSRKYGVATVWLVATLGAKSNTKKVNRKAILNVDVKKACETIIEPEVPMALRLQSNLLYGVSRVYDQQCFYVLQDAQAAQNSIRSLMKTSRSDQLDVVAGKARPEQLMLMDDPAFLPENALPALDFDFSNFNIQNADSQHSTQSMMSIRHRSGSVTSSHAASVLGLNIPSSSSNGGYQLPRDDPFGNSSLPKHFGGTGRDLDEEELVFQDDLLFGYNEDGELRDISEEELKVIRAGSVRPDAHRESSAASGRVRKEHEDGRAGPAYVGENDFNPQFGDDDMGILPDAEPFDALPAMAGGLGGDDQPQHLASKDRVFSDDESSIFSVQAPQKKKSKAKKKKGLVVDKALEIKNAEMKMWQIEYVDRMTAANLLKLNQKAAVQAKKNAFHFVLGSGLNRVGEGIGSTQFVSPLAMFSGKSLLSLVTGRPLPRTDARTKKGTKRAAETPLSSPSKRIHESELGRGASSSHNNPFDDDGGIMMDDDQTQSIEVGRDAGSALPDYPSSAQMPWNMSASLHSHKRNASGSLQGRAGILGSQLGSAAGGRHRTSASPLIGRGSNLPGEMEQFSMLHEEDAPMQYGRDEDFGSQGLGYGAGGGVENSSQGGAEFQSQNFRNEFEIFGQAANVDTQTAGTSQWVREALDKESNNFFEYVKNTISEKTGDELAGDFEELPERKKCVTFEELFDIEGNSKIVAAQAFYHILCLATKHRVWVEQDTMVDNDDKIPEPWGEIRIGVIEASA